MVTGDSLPDRRDAVIFWTGGSILEQNFSVRSCRFSCPGRGSSRIRWSASLELRKCLSRGRERHPSQQRQSGLKLRSYDVSHCQVAYQSTINITSLFGSRKAMGSISFQGAGNSMSAARGGTDYKRKLDEVLLANKPVNGIISKEDKEERRREDRPRKNLICFVKNMA